MQLSSDGNQGHGCQGSRNQDRRAITLVDQTQPQRRPSTLPYPIAEGCNYFGQALFEAESDGSASIQPVILMESGGIPIQATPSVHQPSSAEQSPVLEPPLHQENFNIPQVNRSNNSSFGVDVRYDRSLVSNHGQSASGFSNPAMNQSSGGHLVSIPQDQRVSDVCTADMIERMMRNLGVSEHLELKIKCLNSFKNTQFSETAVMSYVEQLLYYNRGFDVLKCLFCKKADTIGTTFIHENTCTVNRCHQVVQGRSGNQQRGQVQTNANLSGDQRPSLQTATSTSAARGMARPQVQGVRRPVGGAGGGDAAAGGSSSGNTFVKTAAMPRHSAPTIPSRYDSRELRHQTFNSWLFEHIQDPLNLADAGLYYTGTYDKCKCYKCGIELSKWDENDIPWREHAKWSPNCLYLLHRKGQDFVDEVNEDATEQEFMTAPSSFQQNTSLRRENQLTSRYDQCIQTLKDMGIGEDQIKTAIEKFRRVNGGKEFTSQDLADIIYN